MTLVRPRQEGLNDMEIAAITGLLGWLIVLFLREAIGWGVSMFGQGVSHDMSR